MSGRTEGRCGVTGVQDHLRKVESCWSDSVSPKAEWRGERAWSLLPSVAKFLQLFLSVTPSINSHHNSLGNGVYSQPLPAWSREVKGRAPSPHPVLCSEAQSCPTHCHPMDCRQAPLSMEFSWQEYWSELVFPPPGELRDPGIEPVSPASPALQVDSLLTEPWGKLTADEHGRLRQDRAQVLLHLCSGTFLSSLFLVGKTETTLIVMSLGGKFALSFQFPTGNWPSFTMCFISLFQRS